MTKMTFMEFDFGSLKWKPILEEKYSTFVEALRASDKIWDKLLPLQQQGRRFHCRTEEINERR